MNDKQMYKELERFANDCTVSKDINVKMSIYNTSFKPRPPATLFKYEDAEYLKKLIDGATAYLFWKRRKEEKKCGN